MVAWDRIAAESAPRELRDLVAAETVESLDESWQVEAGEPGLSNETGGVSGMPRAVEQHNRHAHGVAEHDWPLDPDRVAKVADVVGAALEAPLGLVVPP